MLREAIQLNPNGWANRFWIGKALERLGEPHEAITWLMDALRIEPNQPTIAKEAANVAMELGDFNVAIAILRGAIDSHPNDGALHYNLGLAYLLSQRLTEARMALESASRLENHELTRRLLELTIEVTQGRRRRPTSLREVIFPEESS
jgi:Flp pilus assembly protein TadD